jgi:hypothetical protein
MRRQSLSDPRAGLTKRQTEVLERLERRVPVKRIASDIGVTPAAVYQTIERLRRDGHLPPDFTPSGGVRRRDRAAAGAVAPGGLAAGASSRLGELRYHADDDELAELIDAAIAAGDAVALAYCLGRADGEGEQGLRRSLLEAALRRLGMLDEPRSEEAA